MLQSAKAPAASMNARTAKSIAARCSHIQLSTGAAPGAAFDHKASLCANALQPAVVPPRGDVGAVVPVEIGGFSVKHGHFLSPFRGPMIAGARGLVPSSPRVANRATRGKGALVCVQRVSREAVSIPRVIGKAIFRRFHRAP